MDYLIVKWLHILSSTVLFGTGIGSAYYLLFTSLAVRRSGDPRPVAVVAHKVVQADLWFTTTTIVFQPLSGWYMAHLAGMPLTSNQFEMVETWEERRGGDKRELFHGDLLRCRGSQHSRALGARQAAG